MQSVTINCTMSLFFHKDGFSSFFLKHCTALMSSAVMCVLWTQSLKRFVVIFLSCWGLGAMFSQQPNFFLK